MISKSRRLLQISMKTELHEAIQQHCAALDVPMAIWAREVIKRELNNQTPAFTSDDN